MLVLIRSEAPTYRRTQQQFQRAKKQTQLFSGQVQSPKNVPYPQYGWQPNGARFMLPSRQEEFTTTKTDYLTTATYYPDEIAATKTLQSGYQSSGWKPQGGSLILPSRQQIVPPATSYDIPKQKNAVPTSPYGLTARLYGPPITKVLGSTISPKEAESTEAIDIDPATPTVNPEAEELDSSTSQQQNGRLETEDVPQQPEKIAQKPGTYFIQYNDGSIQRVIYFAQPANTVALQAQPVSQNIQLYNPVLVPNFVLYSSQYQQSR